MSPSRRRSPWQVGLVILGLVAAHFYVRPWLGDSRAAPDFLLLALLLVSIRSRPGVAAVVGFLVGVATDALTPARFGAGALSHTIVGYLAAWGRAVFFPDNLVVNAGLFAGGAWLRTLVQLLVSGSSASEVLGTLAIWAPIQAITTALVGVLVVSIFRDWLAIRLEE
jgi:rod shape-determining protein MreD